MDEHLQKINKKLSEIDKEISNLRVRIETTKVDYRNCSWVFLESRKRYSERLSEMDSRLTYLIEFKKFLKFKKRLDSFLLYISPDFKVFGNEIEEIAGLKAGDVFIVGNKTMGLKLENEKYYFYYSKEGVSCKWDGISLEETYEEAKHRIANNHIAKALEPENRGVVSVTEEDLKIAGISLNSRNNFERDGILFKAYCRDKKYYLIDRQTIIKRMKEEFERVSKEINETDKEYDRTDRWNTERRDELRCEARKLSKYLKFLKTKEKIENEFDKSHNSYDLFPEDFDNVGLTEDDIIEIDDNSYSFSCMMMDRPWKGYKIVYVGSDKPTAEWDAPTLEETYNNACRRKAFNNISKSIDEASSGRFFYVSREDFEISGKFLNLDILNAIDNTRHEILFYFTPLRKGYGEYDHIFEGIYEKWKLDCMTTDQIRYNINNLDGFMLELCANRNGYFFRKFDIYRYLDERIDELYKETRKINWLSGSTHDYRADVGDLFYFIGNFRNCDHYDCDPQTVKRFIATHHNLR